MKGSARRMESIAPVTCDAPWYTPRPRYCSSFAARETNATGLTQVTCATDVRVCELARRESIFPVITCTSWQSPGPGQDPRSGKTQVLLPSQSSSKCCRARGQAPAAGDGKKVAHQPAVWRFRHSRARGNPSSPLSPTTRTSCNQPASPRATSGGRCKR